MTRRVLYDMAFRLPARRFGSLLIAVALLPVFPASARGQEDAPPPLPELRPFLDDVRQRLRSDESLLAQYTFTEKHSERHLDAKGRVKKTSAEVFEVYPSFERGHTYRRLVERDGRPLNANEIEKQDRRHEAKLEAEARGSNSEAARERRIAKESEARRKEQQVVDELFRVYDIVLAGRENVDGRSAILLTFRPRRGFKPNTRGGKILNRFAGQAWIDEEDRQLVRVEAELIDDLSFGLGVFARLHKGARAYFQRRKVNDEIWLPAEARFTGSARLLLLKGLRIDALSEYSDYRKFTVGTSSEFSPEKTPR